MKKLLKKLEDSMTAITFAEAGDADTARQILNENAEAKRVKKLKVKEETTESLTQKHDRTMEAITFAEAGEYEYARELLKKEETERKKLLVVGNEEGFSETLIYYALGMADRMQYDIVALNVVPIGRRLFAFLNEKTRQELQNRAVEGAEYFKMKTDEKKIQFIHVVRFGEPEKVLKDSHKEFKRISFILAEPENICDETSSKTSIPVFCLADR